MIIATIDSWATTSQLILSTLSTIPLKKSIFPRKWIEIYFPAYKLGDLILPASRLGRLIWFTKVHEMGDGRWEMGDGRWEMGDGRWEMGDGSWELGDGRWELRCENSG
jgi:hypothetical protein